MDVPQILNNILWAVTVLLEIGLLVLLLQRGLQKSHPAFLAYIAFVILQNALIAAAYRIWGRGGWNSYFTAWGSQMVVISARWIAVIEIAKNTIGQYSGIWALAKRIFLVVSVAVLAYGLASSKNVLHLVVLTADRALELCIATFIVCVLIFVRYYRVPMSQMERLLAIGFCLYSCFHVIDDALYEQWRLAMGQLWNYLQTLTFLATLVIWANAILRHVEVREVETRPGTGPELYDQFSGKLNDRLQVLNDRLNQLFRFRGTQL
jgi:hypothetical protein